MLLQHFTFDLIGDKVSEEILKDFEGEIGERWIVPIEIFCFR